MKKAKLKNGKVLEFPDSTPDSVIESVVKRVMGIKEEPELKKVINDLAMSIADRDNDDFYGPALEEHSDVMRKAAQDIITAISKVNFVMKDTTPAIEKQSGVIEKLGGIFKEFIDIFKKNKVDDRELIQKSMYELSKNMVNISNYIEVLSLGMDKNAKMLVESQKDNTEAIYELVKAYKSPRTIIRDKDGKPESIK